MTPAPEKSSGPWTSSFPKTPHLKKEAVACLPRSCQAQPGGCGISELLGALCEQASHSCRSWYQSGVYLSMGAMAVPGIFCWLPWGTEVTCHCSRGTTSSHCRHNWCHLPIPGTHDPWLQVHPEPQPGHTFHSSIIWLLASRWLLVSLWDSAPSIAPDIPQRACDFCLCPPCH